jgi:hypothetical protein
MGLHEGVKELNNTAIYAKRSGLEIKIQRSIIGIGLMEGLGMQ